MINLVALYRAILSPFLGGQCRYQPTCSQYAIDAINKYGVLRGGWRAVKRISRCHPWGGKGYDPASMTAQQYLDLLAAHLREESDASR